MNLPVLQPWYADTGLQFTCSTCGNCCTGGPGFVWISREEITRLATHLNLSPYDVVDRYTRKIDGQFSLTERKNARGEYDCVFLKELPPEPQPQQQQGGPAAEPQVRHTRRVCGIYEARPLQCRTWPFWDGNLASKEAWDHAGRRCHGINRGTHYPPDRIESLRTATDWPANPPTSDPNP
jgi:Fe-S-cluster containining protein